MCFTDVISLTTSAICFIPYCISTTIAIDCVTARPAFPPKDSGNSKVTTLAIMNFRFYLFKEIFYYKFTEKLWINMFNIYNAYKRMWIRSGTGSNQPLEDNWVGIQCACTQHHPQCCSAGISKQYLLKKHASYIWLKLNYLKIKVKRL